MFESLSNGLRTSFESVWEGIANFIPNLLIALIIFVIGLIVANIIGRVVAQIVRALKIDSLIRKANAETYFIKAGIRLDIGKFLGVLVQWFIVIVFLLASLEVLELSQVTDFLKNVVLSYLPSVIVAVLILIAAVIIGDAMQKLVASSARAAELKSANLLGTITKWAVWIFAVLAALFQLGIAAPLLQMLFMGVVTALALSIGLAFGLGGQQAASEIIAKMRKEVADHHHM
ncbi:MAG: hypothetical protein A2655_02690 [Candidatus Yanofskybacteria bacterium RIFCSPHIGHO2_01_FULL_43_42]|uniref:Small-conductance mechanosensitive ion channel n=1 Tax=Candidatus Yanofskybacteria bacterium RIFCSPLOWO2_01_FULL_43_22 TaxID=1802695 RepID=A0A1F8GHR5_9BACT|nr:MAG: hypothetical protein A2655_02690 [Candidatus Yanofskybacteria bacterium RIFCSPHIGHO2_01_FULL_43_42]OGN24945.1 MAG: hypothetical protein A3A13_01480 [Candidatus Yanofskybacteria bacterium RIFCSPLOWO2_01_FULL_43_22]